MDLNTCFLNENLFFTVAMDWLPTLDLIRGNYIAYGAYRPGADNTQYMSEATREKISKEKG